VKLQTSTLDQSQHLRVNCSSKSACENLNAKSARSALCCLQPVLQLNQKSCWSPLRLRILYLHASDGKQHTFNRGGVTTLLQDTDFPRRTSTKLSRIYDVDLVVVQFLSD